MSTATEQLLYAINNMTETLGDLTGLLTELIAEEYELDDDDPDPGEESEPAQLKPRLAALAGDK
jgi:hypothetical protein